MDGRDGWHALGEAKGGVPPPQYRKWKLYDLANNVGVGRDRIVGAPFGGSLAVVAGPHGVKPNKELDVVGSNPNSPIASPSAVSVSAASHHSSSSASHHGALSPASALMDIVPPELRIFTSAGDLQAREPIRVPAPIVAMGGSDQETLAMVHEDGTCMVYTIAGQAW